MSSVEVVYSSDAAEALDQDPDSRDLLDGKMRQIASQLERWVGNARAVTNRSSMFDRGAYTPSENHYDHMRMARKAVQNDDIVGGLAEVTEGLAFDGVKWEAPVADEADVFNQMAAEQDLDSVVRRMHRELYTYSTVTVGFWWNQGNFKVRGKTAQKGNRRKKEYDVWYPQAITTLDSCNVVPVGMMQFGQERLAWQGSSLEIAQYINVLNGNLQDELMTRFYAGQYLPSDIDEINELTSLGVDINRLILLNDAIVKRHCLTKADHMRFPDVRLKRVFRLLDMKQQLMEQDRVTLVGAANYILLVKKGDDKDPAYPEEVANLKENFNYLAKLPVIISDHRLNIEIIAPKTDFSLNPDKYDVIDNRIAATLLGLFGSLGSQSGNRGDTSLQEARLVARNLENQRHMIRRFLEREIAKAVFEHPKNAGVFESTSEPPNLSFVPHEIQLDNDSGLAQSIIALRTMNELSRESTLEFFGFDQTIEAMRRELESSQGLDDTFKSTVPFSATGGQGAPPVAQSAAGGQGGRPAGGGKPTANPQKAPARTSRGTTSTKGASK